MTMFIIEYRAPSMYWDRVDHPSIPGLNELRTSYVTLVEHIEAESLEEAQEVAEAAFGGMLKKVYKQEKA